MVLLLNPGDLWAGPGLVRCDASEKRKTHKPISVVKYGCIVREVLMLD
jgi:hypothetical protein